MMDPSNPYADLFTTGMVNPMAIGPNGQPMTLPLQQPAQGQDFLQQAAMELAKGAPPPPPGSLQQLMQDPKTQAMLMGALKGYGDDRQKMEMAAMSRHYVNPPSVGGGANPQAMIAPLFQAAAKARGTPPLAQSLRGGK